MLALHYLVDTDAEPVAVTLRCSTEVAERALRSGQSALCRRLGLSDAATTASSDLEALDEDGRRPFSLAEWSQAAVAGLTEATDVDPSPLGDRKLLHPKIAQVVSAVVAIAIVAGVVLAASRYHSTGAAASANRVQLEEEARAARIVRQLAAGDYKAVAADYSLGSLPRRYPLQVRNIWQHCLTAYGAYKSQGGPTGAMEA